MKITKNKSGGESVIEEFVGEIIINLKNWIYKSIKSIDKNEYIYKLEYIISYYVSTAHKLEKNKITMYCLIRTLNTVLIWTKIPNIWML